MIGTIIDGVLGGGGLIIAGYGVHRGLGLVGQYLDQRHERELARLSQERLETTVRLEMEQNRAMAEIKYMEDHDALPPALATTQGVGEPYICNCHLTPCPHVHVLTRHREVRVWLTPATMQFAVAGRWDCISTNIKGQKLSDLPMLEKKK